MITQPQTKIHSHSFEICNSSEEREPILQNAVQLYLNWLKVLQQNCLTAVTLVQQNLLSQQQPNILTKIPQTVQLFSSVDHLHEFESSLTLILREYQESNILSQHFDRLENALTAWKSPYSIDSVELEDLVPILGYHTSKGELSFTAKAIMVRLLIYEKDKLTRRVDFIYNWCAVDSRTDLSQLLDHFVCRSKIIFKSSQVQHLADKFRLCSSFNAAKIDSLLHYLHLMKSKAVKMKRRRRAGTPRSELHTDKHKDLTATLRRNCHSSYDIWGLFNCYEIPLYQISLLKGKNKRLVSLLRNRWDLYRLTHKLNFDFPQSILDSDDNNNNNSITTTSIPPVANSTQPHIYKKEEENENQPNQSKQEEEQDQQRYESEQLSKIEHKMEEEEKGQNNNKESFPWVETDTLCRSSRRKRSKSKRKKDALDSEDSRTKNSASQKKLANTVKKTATVVIDQTNLAICNSSINTLQSKRKTKKLVSARTSSKKSKNHQANLLRADTDKTNFKNQDRLHNILSLDEEYKLYNLMGINNDASELAPRKLIKFSDGLNDQVQQQDPSSLQTREPQLLSQLIKNSHEDNPIFSRKDLYSISISDQLNNNNDLQLQQQQESAYYYYHHHQQDNHQTVNRDGTKQGAEDAKIYTSTYEESRKNYHVIPPRPRWINVNNVRLNNKNNISIELHLIYSGKDILDDYDHYFTPLKQQLDLNSIDQNELYAADHILQFESSLNNYSQFLSCFGQSSNVEKLIEHFRTYLLLLPFQLSPDFDLFSPVNDCYSRHRLQSFEKSCFFPTDLLAHFASWNLNPYDSLHFSEKMFSFESVYLPTILSYDTSYAKNFVPVAMPPLWYQLKRSPIEQTSLYNRSLLSDLGIFLHLESKYFHVPTNDSENFTTTLYNLALLPLLEQSMFEVLHSPEELFPGSLVGQLTLVELVELQRDAYICRFLFATATSDFMIVDRFEKQFLPSLAIRLNKHVDRVLSIKNNNNCSLLLAPSNCTSAKISLEILHAFKFDESFLRTTVTGNSKQGMQTSTVELSNFHTNNHNNNFMDVVVPIPTGVISNGIASTNNSTTIAMSTSAANNNSNSNNINFNTLLDQSFNFIDSQIDKCLLSNIFTDSGFQTAFVYSTPLYLPRVTLTTSPQQQRVSLDFSKIEFIVEETVTRYPIYHLLTLDYKHINILLHETGNSQRDICTQICRQYHPAKCRQYLNLFFLSVAETTDLTDEYLAKYHVTVTCTLKNKLAQLNRYQFVSKSVRLVLLDIIISFCLEVCRAS